MDAPQLQDVLFWILGWHLNDLDALLAVVTRSSPWYTQGKRPVEKSVSLC